MDIIYCGYDFFSGCLDVCKQGGHNILGIHSFETDNVYDFNTKTKSFAQNNNIPFHTSPVSRDYIERMLSKNIAVIVAGYKYKLPVVPGVKMINIHPTLLPLGRGPSPMFHIILKQHATSGVTLHKISEQMDAGDILLQEEFPLTNHEDYETLSCKSQLLAKTLLAKLLADVDGYWNKACPQGDKYIYYPFPTLEDRTINWDSPMADIDRVVRAFGKHCTCTVLDGQEFIVTDINYWHAMHNDAIGSVVHRTNRELVVAAKEGYVVLRHYDLDND